MIDLYQILSDNYGVIILLMLAARTYYSLVTGEACCSNDTWWEDLMFILCIANIPNVLIILFFIKDMVNE